MARQELAVMLYFHRRASFTPILSHCSHAMRTDTDDLLCFGLSKRLQVVLRKLSKHQIVA